MRNVIQEKKLSILKINAVNAILDTNGQKSIKGGFTGIIEDLVG